MIICEFCSQYRPSGECAFGLNLAKGMGCREFDPRIENFCSDPNDFVSGSQIIQMANFFGIKGAELKKVKLIATREEARRKIPAAKDSTSMPLLRSLGSNGD
jgi:hypothetical protein